MVRFLQFSDAQDLDGRLSLPVVKNVDVPRHSTHWNTWLVCEVAGLHVITTSLSLSMVSQSCLLGEGKERWVSYSSAVLI